MVNKLVAGKVLRLKYPRRPGCLYFLNGPEIWLAERGEACRDDAATAQLAAARLEREDGYLYFVDADGDISRAGPP